MTPVSSPVNCLLVFGSANCPIHDSIVLTRRAFLTSARYETLSSLFLYHFYFFIQPLLDFILAFQGLPSHIASIPVYIYPTIIKSISKKIQQIIFLQPYVNYYDKIHHEEKLHLFGSCIRTNVSIKLHKTIYEIISTLFLKTHFKPPSSVCNNFLLRSHVEFGCLLLLQYDFYSLL